MQLNYKILIGVGVLGTLGVAGWLWYKKKKQQSMQLVAQQPAAAVTNTFCNPAITDTSGFDKNFLKQEYQKKLAYAEWEKRGRGMSPEYFFELYKQEMGCK